MGSFEEKMNNTDEHRLTQPLRAEVGLKETDDHRYLRSSLPAGRQGVKNVRLTRDL